jgi:hypothetical protein
MLDAGDSGGECMKYFHEVDEARRFASERRNSRGGGVAERVAKGQPAREGPGSRLMPSVQAGKKAVRVRKDAHERNLLPRDCGVPVAVGTAASAAGGQSIS